MDPKKYGVLQGLILDPLLFPVYINDLLNPIKYKAIHILFTANTSILITSMNIVQLESDLNVGFGKLHKWFKANFVTLNFEKTYFIHFTN
jgi:hypothetical protein